MKIVWTKHAEDKLKEKEAKDFSITRKLVSSAIKTAKDREELENGLFRIASGLKPNYSLVVVCKQESAKMISVITFYLAIGGRYESKILQRR